MKEIEKLYTKEEIKLIISNLENIINFYRKIEKYEHDLFSWLWNFFNNFDEETVDFQTVFTWFSSLTMNELIKNISFKKENEKKEIIEILELHLYWELSTNNFNKENNFNIQSWLNNKYYKIIDDKSFLEYVEDILKNLKK